jgi:hypothetical protein
MSSQKTTNLNLHKWIGTDNVKRIEFNENWDSIDAQIKGNSDKIGVLSNLQTTDKTNTVSAINEAFNFPKGFGLGVEAKDISSTDLNNLDATGFYRGGSLTNAPDTGWHYVIHIKHASNNKLQIISRMDGTNKLKIRNNNNGSWTAWTELENTAGSQGKVDARYKAVVLANDASLDTVQDTGVYHIALGTAQGVILAGTYILEVAKSPAPTALVTQTLTQVNTGANLNRRWTRAFNTTWSAWVEELQYKFFDSSTGKAIDLTNDTDVDTLTNPGFYKLGLTITQDTVLVSGTYIVEVQRVLGAVSYLTQSVTAMNGGNVGKTFSRVNNNGSWTAWELNATQEWVKLYGLGTVSKNFTGDLNTIVENGFYYAATASTNKPAGLTNGYVITQVNADTTYSHQTFIPPFGTDVGKMFMRTNVAGVWSAWQKVVSMGLTPTYIHATRYGAGQAIPHAVDTKILFTAEVSDDSVEFTNNEFTAKETGVYAVELSGVFNSTNPIVTLYKNGASLITLTRGYSSVNPISSDDYPFEGSRHVKLAAGDKLAFYITHNVTGVSLNAASIDATITRIR